MRIIMKIGPLFLLVALWTVVSPLIIRGQIQRSSIVGEVTDTSSAVVPAAQVTALNMGTGISAVVTSDASGVYTVPNLQAGTYKVTVTKQGFQTYEETGIQVLTETTVRVDVKLVVGAETQKVEVKGVAPLVVTDSATVGSTLGIHQMTELPFAWQSIDGLLTLVAGAQGDSTRVLVGGATPFGGANFTVNGTQANDMGNASGPYAYAFGEVSMPSIDSMQEFKVESVSTNAEHKTVGSVSIITKSGTNALHGGAYEFYQDTPLNANTFLNNATGEAKIPALMNQFGAHVGGPIKRNKAFFFANYSGLRTQAWVPTQLTLPSMAMRQGDFSALCSTYTAGVCSSSTGTQLYNPNTGQPFPNNQVSSAMFPSQVNSLLPWLPAPNLATNAQGLPNGAPNWYQTVGLPKHVNEYDLRVDYQLSSKDSVFLFLNQNDGFPWGQPSANMPSPSNYGNGTDWGYETYNASLTETHTFSPAMLNSFRLAYFNHPVNGSGQNLTFDPTTLFPQLTVGNNRGLPTMTINGYTGMWNDEGLSNWIENPIVGINDDFTAVHGRHTFKAGVEENGYKEWEMSKAGSLGKFSFNGQWTGNLGQPGQPHSQGNAFADFLLGLPQESATGPVNSVAEVNYSRDWELYAQDTWQATRRLTVYYGLRWSYQCPWYTQGNTRTGFDFQTGQMVLPETSTTVVPPKYGYSPALLAGYKYTTTGALGWPLKYINSQYNGFAPRFGFAFRPFSDNRTVVRGGFGIYYAYQGSYVGSRDDEFNPPWANTGFGATQSYISQLPGNPTSPYLPDITFANPFPSALSQVNGVPPNPGVFAIQRDFQYARSRQWSLTLERELSSNWMARASYVGSYSDHLPWFLDNVDVPLVQQPNVSLQAQRPWQPFNHIYYTHTGGKQKFNQLQLELIKHYSKGMTVQAEYQFTGSLDNTPLVFGPQIWERPDLDYGPSNYGIVRQKLVANYIYELPFGHGKPFLSGVGRLENGLIGGWQVSGITTYSTGTPLSTSVACSTSVVGWFCGRANRIPGASLYAGKQSSSHDVIDGVPWFNPAAFAPPQPWQWGNAARDDIWGPGMWNYDLSARKAFNVTERLRMQLRGDFLDAFNHFNLGSPNNTIADTVDGGSRVPTSGMITSGSGSRVIQLGVRLDF